MQAIVQDEYGVEPESVLRLAEIATPTIGDDEVLVHVRAASVDRGTWHLMTGRPYLIRALGFGLRAPKAPNPGRSLAGTVESVGKNVTEFAPGDEVYGSCDGSFAEYAWSRAKQARTQAHKPLLRDGCAVPDLGGHRAAGAPRQGEGAGRGSRCSSSARRAASGRTRCRSPRRSGLRSRVCAAPRRWTWFEPSALTTSSTTPREDFTDGKRRYDVILDIGGNRRLSQLRRALTAKGTLVIVGGETDGRWLGGFDRQIRAHFWSLMVSQNLTTLTSSENSADLVVLRELIESGKVTPRIDETYPLGGVPMAIRHLSDGRARQGRHQRLRGRLRFAAVSLGECACFAASPTPTCRAVGSLLEFETRSLPSAAASPASTDRLSSLQVTRNRCSSSRRRGLRVPRFRVRHAVLIGIGFESVGALVGAEPVLNTLRG